MQNKFSIQLPHGKVDGVYLQSLKENSPVVIITNGMNGFYNYGMFPCIQEQLLANGISSVSYNFSHGGVEGDSDYFTQVDLYEKNCMRLEIADLIGVVQNLNKIGVSYSKGANKLFLLSHSLGYYPTVYATNELLSAGIKIDGVVLLAPSMTLDFWSKEQMAEWESNGVLLYENKRTNQKLPLGKEFLEETKQSRDKWNLEKALAFSKVKFLILHGKNDESIPVEEAEAINSWNQKLGNECELVYVENATHTFNVKHPFTGTTPELNFVLEKTINWIKG